MINGTIEFSAVLLAGGKSSRLGRDKAGLGIDGLPLWQRQIRALRAAGAAEVFVSGRQGAVYDIETLADDIADAGPLTGLILSLRRARFPLLLVLAVDLPGMTSAYLQKLVSLARPGVGVIPRRGGFFEPLAAIYPREALAVAEQCRTDGELALHVLARRLMETGLVLPLEASEDALFANINTPEDLALYDKHDTHKKVTDASPAYFIMAASIPMKEKIGFVGVGRMGANMARRLTDQGYNVTSVYDHHASLADDLAREIGAESASTLARVTELSDIIVTVVTDDAAMRKIFATTGDSLLTGAKGKLFINCATVTPQVHFDVEALAQKAGSSSLEACMASSITQAREGTLYLMAGGAKEAFDRAAPVLKDMSVTLRHIGPTGSAAQVKALVNMVMNINTAGLAEGLGLGAALGLDLTVLREVFSQTGANSRVLATDGEDMQNRDHSCFFSASHAAKDSGIALSLAKDAGLTLPLAEATKKQYDRMVAEGFGELDKSGIAELTFPNRGKK